MSGVPAGTHRRLARTKRWLEDHGATRIPGYRRFAQGARALLFPDLATEAECVAIRLSGVTLEVPRSYLPTYLHRAYEPVTTAAFLRRSIQER